MISAMGLMGVTSIDQLSAKDVVACDPVGWSHEMSQWVNMPGGRLL
jgi:hypothetical protein